MAPPPARHLPPALTVPSGCDCQFCAVVFAQPVRTAVAPETAAHLPGVPDTSGAAGRSQCSFGCVAELAQVAITGRAPLAALAAGMSRHFIDLTLTSWALLPACHTWPRSAELQVNSWSFAPLAVEPLTTSRHLPPVLIVPSPTTVQFWFALPVQDDRSTGVLFAVFPE